MTLAFLQPLHLRIMCAQKLFFYKDPPFTRRVEYLFVMQQIVVSCLFGVVVIVFSSKPERFPKILLHDGHLSGVHEDCCLMESTILILG